VFENISQGMKDEGRAHVRISPRERDQVCVLPMDEIYHITRNINIEKKGKVSNRLSQITVLVVWEEWVV